MATTAWDGSVPANVDVAPGATSKALGSAVLNAPLPFNWLNAVCKASMAELVNSEPVIFRTDKVLAGAVAFPVMALPKRPGANAAAEKLSLAADVLTPA